MSTSIRGNVNKLLRKTPAIPKDEKLVFWACRLIYDGIDIPKDTLKRIATRGWIPDTSTRYKRHYVIGSTQVRWQETGSS